MNELPQNPSPSSVGPAPRPQVHLHIEELVLHGTSPHDRLAVADAIQEELVRLFSEQGVPTWARAAADMASLHGAPLPSRLTAPAEKFGANIAASVYGAAPAGPRAATKPSST